MRDLTFYGLLNEGIVGFENYQAFVDKTLSDKYNMKNMLPQGVAWGKNQTNFKYFQADISAKVYALPSFVDYKSVGKTHGFEKMELSTGSIPRMKHRYIFDEDTVRENMELMQRMQGGDSELQDEMTKLLYNSTDSLVGGNKNALNMMRHMVVSTGTFVLDGINNPDGIAKEFDFQLPEKNKLKTSVAAWSDDSADPVEDLLRMQEFADDNGLEYGHFEMSKALWNVFRSHPNVKKALLSTVNLAATSDNVAAYPMQDEQLKLMLAGIGLPPITIIDSVVYVDSLDRSTGGTKNTPVRPFNQDNVALIPDGIICEAKTVKPIKMVADNNPYALYMDNRMILTQVANTQTNSQYVESEFTALVVPTKIRNFVILDTTQL